MNSFQSHYHKVVQQDLVLTENVSSVSLIPNLKKISLSVGGDAAQKPFVISSLAALKIITGQQPYLTCQKSEKQKHNKSRQTVGGKITLRGSKCYEFWEKLLFEVFPSMKQFEGLHLPKSKSVFCFTLKDAFTFQELVPRFTYFEEIKAIQCQFSFSTQTKSEIFMLGRGLLFCFVANEK